ncbi:hypothetical protein ENBRE01_0315 [Enteropsectra breve]|nr:hypothetical protein ENBRE01_0315 [Enteropsectra breve]
MLVIRSNASLSDLLCIGVSSNQRRIKKREVCRMCITALICDINLHNHKFSFRIYGLFAVGLAKIWFLKLEGIKKMLEAGSKVARKRSVRALSTQAAKTLAINEEFIDHLSEIEQDLEKSFERSATKEDFRFETGFLIESSDEMPRNASHLGSVQSMDINNAASRRICIDEILELPASAIFHAPTRKNDFKVHTLLSGHIISSFFMKEEVTPVPQENSLFELDSQPSMENLRYDINEQNELQDSGRALEFYNILLKAARGEIFVYQDKPYGEIVISQTLPFV